MKAIRDLIEFCLKERTDAADWKDDSGKFISLAKRAKEVLPGLEKELAGDTEDLVRRSYEAIDRYPPLMKDKR
jgi:hypothetical protein